MAPTYTVSLATEVDIPSIVEVWISAWPESPLMKKVFPRTEDVKEWTLEAYRQHMKDNTSTILVVTEDKDGNRGNVVSYTLMFRVGVDLAKEGTETENGSKDRVSTWQSRWVRGRELAEGMTEENMGKMIFAPMERQHQRIMGGRRHIFLEVLGTHPDHQRKGLASKMLKWSSEIADREGLEVYLDASDKGKPLYEKFGFRPLEELMDEESRSVPMLRPKVNS